MIFFIGCVFYEVSLKDFKFIGVTGTSGKTTTSTMIYNTLRANKFKVGLISTVGIIAGDENLESGYHVTTPDPLDIVRFLKIMKSKGIEYVVLESSSHALEQGRIGNIKYDIAVYTHIANDHLDWHKTWENYARAKARMIDRLNEGGLIIINRDHEKSYLFLKKWIEGKKLKNVSEYSLEECSIQSESLEGINFRYKNCDFEIKIIGQFNISNALATIKVCEYLNLDLKKIALGLKEFKTLQGRMEIYKFQPFTVILDFAHNGDSLEKSLETAKKLVRGGGRLISVFGSAGLRDLNKRGEMGRISGKIADITILTAEDPRTEKLYNINSDIIEGINSLKDLKIQRVANHDEYIKIANEIDNKKEKLKDVYVFDEENVNSRFDAIEFAIKIAKEGDVVITNGKGHERTLAFGVKEYPFSDGEAIKKALSIFL